MITSSPLHRSGAPRLSAVAPRPSTNPTVPVPAGEPLELVSLRPLPLPWLGDDFKPTWRPSAEVSR